jgi:hypothetical protein
MKNEIKDLIRYNNGNMRGVPVPLILPEEVKMFMTSLP